MSLQLKIRPSRRLAAMLAVAHLVAAAAVLASGLPSLWMAILLALVGASLAWSRRPATAHGLVLHDDGRLDIIDANGAASPTEIDPQTFVSAPLTVLVYRLDGRLRSLVVLGDSVDADDLRRLRTWLRWKVTLQQPA